ncbi:hypothetical protein ACI68E_001668 [Malassezia pachydermatis]|uniref:Uncharacterized protein n=1 Tax=Malassezia pachydermatis TaxID=77020 RepID=A0A0M9VRC9_9BASI|nr:hypothetical protein Malapachy_3106 [Malassezia pachydermatis]KOS16489.1 hypothetical protein Malapachy_3106 [Malassezia pachydermatis]
MPASSGWIRATPPASASRKRKMDDTPQVHTPALVPSSRHHAPRSPTTSPSSSSSPATPMFTWQRGLADHMPKYKKWAHMETSPDDRASKTTSHAPTMRSPTCAARWHHGRDQFAYIEQVWHGATDTPTQTRAPPKTQQQTTLDAFMKREAVRSDTAPPGAVTAAPAAANDDSDGNDTSSRASSPSISSCSSVPSISDDAEAAHTWLRAIGSSPTHWV